MKNLVLVLILTFSTAVFAGEKKTSKEPIKPLTLTNNYQVTNYKDIFFGGQPTEEQVKEMRKQGFSTIISLRDPKDKIGFDEGEAAKANGLQYVNIPVSDPKQMTPEKVDEITAAVVKARGNGRVMVHCQKGGMVGLWAGTHFQKDHGYSAEEAKGVATKIGMPEKFSGQLMSNMKASKAK